MRLDRLLVTAGAALFASLSAANDIQGVVTGPNGPEAGVWVIAETAELPTKFARIVVTDDEGRYLVPDLPKASYEIWVRGYGLIDSPKVKAAPGERLDLTAVPAPSEEEAASEEMRSQPVRSDEVAKGALPVALAERPKGAARNLVVTTWDWSQPQHAVHGLVSTDRRDPRLNANGRLYGSPEESTGLVPMLDPKTHSSSTLVPAVRDATRLAARPVLDEKRTVWFSARVASGANPDFCKGGSSHPSAKAFPLEGEANADLSTFETKRGTWTLIRTCFSAQHLNLGFDDDHTLWTSTGAGGAQVIGWLNRYVYERTGDDAKAQGWTPFVLDTSGDGKRGAYVEPEAPVEPKKDKRIAVSLDSIAASPLDGTVWGTVPGRPGGIVRVAPGGNPTFTALSEYYEVAAPGYGPRGGDIDTNGVYWVSLASGHLGRFVRASCKLLNGAAATGKHCPEGWTFYQLPGPQLRDVKSPGSAETTYHTWVDWSGILGLGRNIPIAMGNGADAVHALVKGEFVTLHIPYPQGVFPKSLDGRIDNGSAGWKGRGLWTTSGLSHGERSGEGRPKVVKLQVRPHPLAR